MYLYHIYLEYIGLHALSSKPVVIRIEGAQFWWQHGKFDQPVLSDCELLKLVEFAEGSILDLSYDVSRQVNSFQSY